VHEVIDLEEAVLFLQILDATHGADLRSNLRMIALDFVIAQQKDAFPVRDELPFKKYFLFPFIHLLTIFEFWNNLFSEEFVGAGFRGMGEEK